ncbi:MAG: hypothetical protein CMN87_10910 [Stappia sp.]|uniref:hypothetical protein n=1 Tax=Stappia sp. TaxID=1870903 RepID=UPI000C562308|nr:hypothetical protein [Stappia sp.]MAA98663.1 hypothetical protein [Stappia sp.]MBM20508.1 hypothetical protein [Stappia sp.]|tara:strand:+ start:870 stop:1073 length:204 start_codon:yes stop_codon:yes gene_type:complete
MTDDSENTIDPAKELQAWKAYFAYAAQDLETESSELLVACAHRLLEMAQEEKKSGRGRRRTAPSPED